MSTAINLIDYGGRPGPNIEQNLQCFPMREYIKKHRVYTIYTRHHDRPLCRSIRFNWLRKDQKNKEEICYGTDLNRNWNHNWNEKGSSKSECSEFYAGPNAFSEPETKALSKFLEEQKKNIKASVSISDN